MLPLPLLLAPVSPDSPSGVDSSSTMILSELEMLVRREVGMVGSEVPEEPDWKLVETQALTAAKASKDLRIAGLLTAALLRSTGLEGLWEGLQLIHGYLETYWDSVYPQLDASDANDPTERINAIANLAAPLGSDGDALRMIEAVRKAAVLTAPQVGRFTLEHYLAAKGAMPWPANAGAAPTPALLEAAAKDAGASAVTQTIGIVEGCLIEANTITSIFKTRSGPSMYPVLEPLTRELKTILTWLGGPAKANAALAATAERTAASTTAGVKSPSNIDTPAPLSGEITSRDDVIRALDGIVRYYEQNEPSSPVPFLLKRIRRLVPMDFLQLITELTPDSTDKILLLTGRIEEKTP